MMNSVTVSAELGLSLVVPEHGAVPLVASLDYSADDPYAIKMAFHVGADEPVEWIFGRELLARGLQAPAGEGDVQVWPGGSPDGYSAGHEVLNIALSSPFGEFVLPRGEESRYPVVFLAGGIGVTPFRSMIRERSRNERTREGTPPPTLVTINRSPEETPFYEECGAWDEKKWARWVPIETRSPKADGAGREELVRRAMEEVFLRTGMEARIYLAGPPAMVDSLSEILTRAFGFPRERLTVDLFFGYA